MIKSTVWIVCGFILTATSSWGGEFVSCGILRGGIEVECLVFETDGSDTLSVIGQVQPNLVGQRVALYGSLSTAAKSSCMQGLPTIVVDSVTACVSCCSGLTGNIDMDPYDTIDLNDLLCLARSLFLDGPALVCRASANTDGDPECQVDLSDVLWLANAAFLGGPPAAPCRPECE